MRNKLHKAAKNVALAVLLLCLTFDLASVSHFGDLLGDEGRTAGLHLTRRRRYLRRAWRGRRRMRVGVRHRRAEVLVLDARVGSAVADEVAAAVVLLPAQALRLHGRDVDHEADDDGDEPQDPRGREHPRPHPVAHWPRLPPVADVAGLDADPDHEQHLGEPEADPCEEEEAAGLPGERGGGRRDARVVLRDGEAGGGGVRHCDGDEHVGVLGEHGDGEQDEGADGVGERGAAAAVVEAHVQLVLAAAHAHQVVRHLGARALGGEAEDEGDEAADDGERDEGDGDLAAGPRGTALLRLAEGQVVVGHRRRHRHRRRRRRRVHG